MKDNTDICPRCGSKMKLTETSFSYHGKVVGNFEAYMCDNCKSVYFTEKGAKDIVSALMPVTSNEKEIIDIVKQSNQVRRVQYKIGKEFITFIHDASKSWCRIDVKSRKLHVASSNGLVKLLVDNGEVDIGGKVIDLDFTFDVVYVDKMNGNLVFVIDGSGGQVELTSEGINLVAR